MILNDTSSITPQPLYFRLSLPLTRLLSQYELLSMFLLTSNDVVREQLQTACADWLATAQRELMLLAHFFLPYQFESFYFT